MSSTKEDITLSKKYQKKSAIQHILDAPDTYVGSIEKVESLQHILNEAGDKIIEKNIEYIPGLFKLFDEGIVNCRDHVVRMLQAISVGQPNCIPVSNIEITISEDGTITMMNDGNGIDVAEHPEHKTWIPQMIFGQLLTSSNYNDEEARYTSGRNGM